MKIVFARHGESEANLLNVFSNRGFKHGLTERGRKQATGLAQRLSKLYVSRVFSSPLLRAVQTAEILAAQLDTGYQIMDSLREYDCGVLEGRSDAASWAEYERVSEDWLVHQRWDSRIEGGESFVEIKDRFVPFTKHLVETSGDSPESVILVGHGGLYRCMLPLVLVNIDFGFAMQHPLAYTEYVAAETRGKELVCVEWQRARYGPQR